VGSTRPLTSGTPPGNATAQRQFAHFAAAVDVVEETVRA
jgi:hypothetical protein